MCTDDNAHCSVYCVLFLVSRLNLQDGIEIDSQLQVLVRSSPEDKKSLVEILENCWRNWR
jgi:hypothetical protein